MVEVAAAVGQVVAVDAAALEAATLERVVL